MHEFQESKNSGLQLAQLAKELKEGTFVYHMNKAIAAHERGDAKKKQMHLDNAKTARYSMKSTEIAKHKDLLDKYSQMREEVELDEAGAYQKDIDEKKPVHAQGVKGMKSKPFTKKFKTMDHFNKWADSEKSGDHEVHRVYQEEIEKILASDEFAALDEESKNVILARLESISESAAHDSEAHYEHSNNKKSSCNENRATISFRAFLAKLEEAKKYVEEDEEDDEERADKKADRKYPVKIHDGDDDGKNLGEEEKHIKLADVKMALKNVKNASSHTKKMIKANPTQKLPHGMSRHAAYSEEFELDEGQTVKTKTGVIHKGTYGSEYEGDEKKKEAPAVKRGRGRPKKGSDESGNAKKYTFHDLLNRLSR